LKFPEHAGVHHASIGPITSKTMENLGMAVDVEARSHDILGLVTAIVRFFHGWIDAWHPTLDVRT